MNKGRLEAFSDGVIAIIITIMVLELKVPHTSDLSALTSLLPIFLTYVVSFVFVGIYWNNHHHMLHLVERINGKILWANLHLLFWLSLVPFATEWMAEVGFAPLAVAFYGLLLFWSGVAFLIMQIQIVKLQGPHSALSAAIGNNWKGKASVAIYAVAIPSAFFNPLLACGFYVVVAIMWFIPDKRIEDRFNES